MICSKLAHHQGLHFFANTDWETDHTKTYNALNDSVYKTAYQALEVKAA